MTKERLALAFAVAVFLGVFIYVCPVQASVPAAGTALSQTEFARRYGTYESSGERDDAPATAEVTAGEDAAITITSAAVRGTHLTLGASVSVGNAHKTLSASGTLYNSIKTQHGVNSIVGALQDGMGNYDVLHFEIYNDTTEDAFYSNETWRGRPHLKLYLLDKSDDSILLFETAIPETLRNITVEGDAQALYLYDGGWFLDFVPYEITESEADTPATCDSSWYTYSLPTVSLNTSLNGVAYTFTSNASIQYQLNNIVCDGYWKIKFQIGSCTQTVGGTVYSSTGGWISYSGGWISYSDITCDVGAGQYTEIWGIRHEGIVNCLQQASLSDLAEGAGVILGLAQVDFTTLGFVLPTATIAMSAISLLSSMNVGYTTVALKSGHHTFATYTSAVRTKLSSEYKLLTTSQNYNVILDVMYSNFGNTSAPSSVSTYGVVRFSGNYGLMNYTSTAVTYTYKGSFDSGNLQCSYVVKDA